MAFWTQDISDGSQPDPKRNFRFSVSIGFQTAEGGANIVWWAKKINKPNFTIQESKHAFLNHTFYWPGRVEWQTISTTLVDPVSPDATLLTAQLIEAAGYKIPGSDDASNLVSMSKSGTAAAIQGVIITQFDSAGASIETWTLKNPFIKSVKFGDLDYENDDLTQIELEFRYDWAELNPVKAGGPAVFSTTG